jgi:hypothetical protein
MIKRTVIVRPVGHFLHGFHFRTTSYGGVYPIVQLFHPLFVPRVHIPFGGMPQDHRSDVGTWEVTEPDVERKLMDALGGDMLDSLLRIDTSDKFLVWADHLSYAPEWRMFAHALAGRLTRAVRLAEQQIEYLDYLSAADGSPRTTSIRPLRRLIRIFGSGQARTNRLLRTFERTNVRNIGVEGWWRWLPVAE